MSTDAATELALAARAGDQAAVSLLVRATQQQVWRFCAHLVDPAAADDLTQETYLRAFRTLRSFRGDGSAISWLLTIARRVAADEIARRQRRSRLQTELESHAPEALSDHAGLTAVEVLVAGLAEDRRSAFVLTQVLGFSYEEAAAVCDCATGTIRSRVARARAELVGALAEDGRVAQRAS
ncbi:MAG: polymerase sigma-70 factor, subfamily [Frankiaceae bacterium]|nr:polymerase sigma-70 factor, subfamily [Frankiaceae bacterium]MDQ1635781.1 polymerase sigma-70 factor, subfamily [Frankiaceae bacterium]MDQ1650421.1 polymerase sigma-70 factor, subfamily [Frankiaceae bacterium]